LFVLDQVSGDFPARRGQADLLYEPFFFGLLAERHQDILFYQIFQTAMDYILEFLSILVEFCRLVKTIKIRLIGRFTRTGQALFQDMFLQFGKPHKMILHQNCSKKPKKSKEKPLPTKRFQAWGFYNFSIQTRYGSLK
jgi:hypothetical protein